MANFTATWVDTASAPSFAPYFDVQISRGSFDHISRVLAGIRNGAGIAVSRAINHVVARSKTALIRAVVRRTGLPMSFVRRRVSATKARRDKLFARLRVWGKIPVALRKPRQTKKGVTALNVLTGHRENIPHAFIAQFRGKASAHRGKQRTYRTAELLSRYPAYPKGTAVVTRVGKGRGPLESVFKGAQGQLGYVAQERGVPQMIRPDIEAGLRARIPHEVEFLITREAKKAR